MATFRMQRNLGAWLGIILVGLLGLVLVVGPDVTHGRAPGDAGDARFNNYVLENGYRWLSGQTASFWNAPFYYPFPLTIAFSGNHLGTVSFYSFFRTLGLDREDSFDGWYVFGYVVNFVACGYTLRRLNHAWLASALGAFLFAFGLPITVQSAHAQLLYRFCVPLAVLALLKFAETPKLLTLFTLGFWTVWQFFCEIYTGYFLSLLLVAFIVAYAVTHGRGARGMLWYWPTRLVTAWRGGAVRGRIIFICASAALVIALALLLRPYLEVTKLYGFKRGWDEIASMLPRPASYLLSGNSELWRFSWSGFDALPMRHEHAMFMGAAPLLAIIIVFGLYLTGKATLHRVFATACLSIILLVVLTLWVDGYSIYRLVAELPGANSIRAITRIIVILVFPASMLLASSLDAMSGAKIHPAARVALPLLIASLLVFECSDINHYVSLKSNWRLRLQAAANELPGSLPDAPIIVLAPRPTEPTYMRELDGMLLAQEHGWATLNGYSGNVPPGHLLTVGCQSPAANVAQALNFLGRPGSEPFNETMKRVVPVGFINCDQETTPRSERSEITRFAGPLPTSLMSKTTITIDSIRLVDNAPVVVVTIDNHGDQPIPARSSTGMPVRISAEYFPADSLTPDVPRAVHWDSRQDLNENVMPGKSVRVDVPLSPPPREGTYIIVASLVQDGYAWFHDQGMKVAMSKQTIMLRDGVSTIGELSDSGK